MTIGFPGKDCRDRKVANLGGFLERWHWKTNKVWMDEEGEMPPGRFKHKNQDPEGRITMSCLAASEYSPNCVFKPLRANWGPKEDEPCGSLILHPSGKSDAMPWEDHATRRDHKQVVRMSPCSPGTRQYFQMIPPLRCLSHHQPSESPQSHLNCPDIVEQR